MAHIGDVLKSRDPAGVGKTFPTRERTVEWVHAGDPTPIAH